MYPSRIFKIACIQNAKWWYWYTVVCYIMNFQCARSSRCALCAVRSGTIWGLHTVHTWHLLLAPTPLHTRRSCLFHSTYTHQKRGHRWPIVTNYPASKEKHTSTHRKTSRNLSVFISVWCFRLVDFNMLQARCIWIHTTPPAVGTTLGSTGRWVARGLAKDCFDNCRELGTRRIAGTYLNQIWEKRRKIMNICLLHRTTSSYKLKMQLVQLTIYIYIHYTYIHTYIHYITLHA